MEKSCPHGYPIVPLWRSLADDCGRIILANKFEVAIGEFRLNPTGVYLKVFGRSTREDFIRQMRNAPIDLVCLDCLKNDLAEPFFYIAEAVDERGVAA